MDPEFVQLQRRLLAHSGTSFGSAPISGACVPAPTTDGKFAAAQTIGLAAGHATAHDARIPRSVIEARTTATNNGPQFTISGHGGVPLTADGAALHGTRVCGVAGVGRETASGGFATFVCH